jgi:hypothetical protein
LNEIFDRLFLVTTFDESQAQTIAFAIGLA